MKKFDTGATRNEKNSGTLDYNQYLSPIALQRYAEYMKKHALQDDGTYRDGDNWKKGVPMDSFINSGSRHFMDWWLETEGHPSRDGLEEALCGLLFNTLGYLHETLQTSGGVRRSTMRFII